MVTYKTLQNKGIIILNLFSSLQKYLKYDLEI